MPLHRRWQLPEVFLAMRGLREFCLFATTTTTAFFPVPSLSWLLSSPHQQQSSKAILVSHPRLIHRRRHLVPTTAFSPSSCYHSIHSNCIHFNKISRASMSTTATSLLLSTASAASSSVAAAESSLEDLAQQLIDQKDSKLVIAVAGGGGHAISSLAATPGASAVLYEGTITYDRNSFRNYVAKSQQHMASATKAMTSLEFKFASLEAAQLLSEVSLQRALTYAAVQDANIHTYTSNQHIGIGCASALVSNKHKMVVNNNNNNDSNDNNDNNDKNNQRDVDSSSHSHTSKNNQVNNNNNNNNATAGYHYARKGKSRAFVVATRADGRQWYGNLTLVEGRSRLEEDLMVSHFLLQAAHQVNRDDYDDDDYNTIDEKDNHELNNTILIPNMLPGDEIHNWFLAPRTPATTTTDTITPSETALPPQYGGEEDVVITAAQRIVQGEAQVILLVPTKSTSSSSASSSGYTFRAVQYPVLPHASLIFPGSYNPPHVGHAELAKAALHEVMGGDDNDDNDSTTTASHIPAVFMEMSLTNPDKPSMDPLVVSQRAHQFFQLMEYMPQNWGLLLTRAPLFAQKVELLNSLIAPASPEYNTTRLAKKLRNKKNSFNDNDNNNNNMYLDHDDDTDHHLFFILGTDTMIRILNPKYYGNNFEAMVRAVRGMRKHHVHFIAGGRLDQITPTSEKFVTGEAELEGLPPDIQDMFTLLREFRIDISSSAIRQRQQQTQPKTPAVKTSESQNPQAQPLEGS